MDVRRQEFDSIVEGWGSDDLDDLIARVELLREFWAKHMPLTPAEHKIARAIIKRLGHLGGIDIPEFH